MTILVFHMNINQKVSLAEEDFDYQVDRMTHSAFPRERLCHHPEGSQMSGLDLTSHTFRLRLELYHQVSWVSSWPSHLAELGTCQLP